MNDFKDTKEGDIVFIDGSWSNVAKATVERTTKTLIIVNGKKFDRDGHSVPYSRGTRLWLPTPPLEAKYIRQCALDLIDELQGDIKSGKVIDGDMPEIYNILLSLKKT